MVEPDITSFEISIWRGLALMDWLYDDRTDCWSVLTTIPVKQYLDLVRSAHTQRGALAGQRDVLQTTTAKRIRERMVSDIRQGAVLPPIVVGVVVSAKRFKEFPIKAAKQLSDIVSETATKELAIIDGMQRTGALFEAADIDKEVLAKSVRVEFWLATSVRSMIYRMLVLNTGQVPWTLSRQLTVVYSPLVAEIKKDVPAIERIFTPDKPGRRVGPAQFSSDALVELYISFSLRKTNVDTKEALSEEFSRLDFVENLSDKSFQGQFYEALNILIELDTSFSRYEGKGSDRYSKGRNIFDGQPARIGFIVALAQSALGRPGLERSAKDRKERFDAIKKSANIFVTKLNAMPSDKLGEFLKLDVLSETLDKRVGQIGRYERSVFFEAFKVLIEEQFKLPNLEACWRAS